jgi:hypothetical protein
VPGRIASLATVKDYDASGDSTYLLQVDDGFWLWGQNRYGNLGNGNTTQQGTPLEHPTLSP